MPAATSSRRLLLQLRSRTASRSGTWSEKYATQPEILRYAQFVADKHDLRRDIRFDTRVESAAWDDDTQPLAIHTDNGDDVTRPHYVMATGCLSVPKEPDIDGTDRFGGEVYFTSSGRTTASTSPASASP